MLKNSQNLFPITKIIASADGYFMDRAGEVWSERARKGSLIKLAGSTTSSGRYVTMQTNGRFGQSYKLNDLQRRCKAHKDWNEDTRPLPSTDRTIPSAHQHQVAVPKTTLAGALGLGKSPVQIEIVSTRHHAADANDGIAKRGWVIASVKNGKLSFAAEPTIHTSDVSVISELDRLAKQSPGVKYVKLQIQGAAVAGALQWE